MLRAKALSPREAWLVEFCLVSTLWFSVCLLSLLGPGLSLAVFCHLPSAGTEALLWCAEGWTMLPSTPAKECITPTSSHEWLTEALQGEKLVFWPERAAD